jgi:hypothetical protein
MDGTDDDRPVLLSYARESSPGVKRLSLMAWVLIAAVPAPLVLVFGLYPWGVTHISRGGSAGKRNTGDS